MERERGNVLFFSLIFSLLILIAFAGLLTLWLRYTQTVFPVKTYSTVREAVAGGIKLITPYIDKGCYDITAREDSNCPGRPMGTLCYNNIIPYKIFGDNRIFQNTVVVCFLGLKEKSHLAGVTENPSKLGEGQIYSIYSYSTAAMHNVTALIEAIYMR